MKKTCCILAGLLLFKTPYCGLNDSLDNSYLVHKKEFNLTSFQLPDGLSVQNIDQTKYAGHSDNYISIYNENNSFALVILRPARLENYSDYLNNQKMSEYLEREVEIISQKPLLVDQGKYAIVWVSNNNKSIPVVITLFKKEIEIHTLETTAVLTDDFEFTQDIQGHIGHPYLLGSIYSPSEGFGFFTLDAGSGIIKRVSSGQQKWEYVDGMQVTSDGMEGIALVRKDETSSQQYLPINLHEGFIILPETEIALDYSGKDQLIEDFHLFNTGCIATYDSSKQKLTYFSPCNPKSPYGVHYSSYNIIGNSVAFHEKYLFFLEVEGQKINLIVFDFCKLDPYFGTPWLKKTIINFNETILDAKKRFQINGSHKIEISPLHKYSDRHLIFQATLYLNNIENDDPIDPKGENIIVFPLVFNLDTTNMKLNTVDLAKITEFDRPNPYSLEGWDVFDSYLSAAKIDRSLLYPEDDTLLIADPKENRILFYRMPSIGRAPVGKTEHLDLNRRNKAIPGSGDKDVIHIPLGFKGAHTLGSFFVPPTEVGSSILTNYNSTLTDKVFYSPNPYRNFVCKGISENLNIRAGAEHKGAQVYAALLTSDNDMINLSASPGLALHSTDDGSISVGFTYPVVDNQPQKHLPCPTIWGRDQNNLNNYHQMKFEGISGQYNFVDRTGTWVAGKWIIDGVPNAIGMNIKTDKNHGLGFGSVFEGTWDASILCGKRMRREKEYVCLWHRHKDGNFNEEVLEESEGFNDDCLLIDRQHGSYVIYKKGETFYCWSKIYGSVELQEFLKTQKCFLFDQEHSLKECFLPKVKAVHWCDGKDILVTGIDDEVYLLHLKELHSLSY